MPIQLAPPVEKEFVLETTDKFYGNTDDPTLVRIRQATRGDIEKRDQRSFSMTQIIDQAAPSQMMYRDFITIASLRRYEVFLTLVDCNIIDQDGKPLFRFRIDNGRRKLDMTEAEFNASWSMLDETPALEIIKFVHEMNVSWKNSGEAS